MPTPEHDEYARRLQDSGYGATENISLSSSATGIGEIWPVPNSSPLPIGTVFSSAMNLAACALGASMLSLPYVMMTSGPLIALFMMVLFGVMAFFAAQAVANAGLRCRRSSYDAIVRFYFGTYEGIIAEILLAVALLVAAISYIVGLADLLPKMIPVLQHVSRNALIVITLATLFPFTLISNLASFGAASGLAVFGCYVQAGALLAQLFTQSDWEVPPRSVWYSVDMGGLLYCMPMTCFVYAFHYVLTETLCELKHSTRKRITVVDMSTICIQIGCYLPMAIAGYLAYSGKNIPTNVLEGLPAGSTSVVIARWSIGGLLLVTYSLFIIPLRQKLEKKLYGILTSSMSDPRRVGAVVALNVSVGIAAVSLPNLGLANSVAGGCIALIMLFYPGRMMLLGIEGERGGWKQWARKTVGVVFALMGVLICFVGIFGKIIVFAGSSRMVLRARVME